MATKRTDMDTEDTPLDAARMLALAENQQRSVEQQVAAFVPWILMLWGAAWLLGFGALWLIDGLDPAFALPLPLAVTVFAVLLAVAIAGSAVLGIRSGRGIRGNTASAFSGAVYGCSWTLGSIAIVVFGQGLVTNGMEPDLANIFYPVAYVLFAGIMYIVGAAIWQAVPMLVLGIWTLLIAAAAPFFGYPGHYLWLSLAGGCGMLVMSLVSFAWIAKARRAASGVRRG